MENTELLENELISLCKNCSIGYLVFADLALVPQYVEAIRNYDGVLDNDKLYNIIKSEYFSMLSNNIANRYATRAMKSISKFATGDKYSWKAELSEDMRHKLELKRLPLRFELPSQKLYRIFRIPEFLQVFVEFGVRDDLTAYDACKVVWFELLKDGYDKENPNECDRAYKIKKMVEDYAEALGKETKDWKKDYNKFLETKTFVVRKASRNGGYEKMYFTEDEISFFKQKDEQLDDADEDL